jgi:sarcosine oxidase subunit beta
VSDVAVVGAGVVGLSVAFHLAERGADSIVVYERSGIGAGASGIQPGGVRQQWATRANCLMARASLGFYRELHDRLEPRIDPGFTACGYLFVAHETATLDRMRAALELQHETGVPSQLLTPEEAETLVPGLHARGVIGGTFCTEDGYFDRPQSVVEAFAAAAQRRGVRIVHADVRTIERSGSGWRLTFADGSAAEMDTVVVAAAVDTTGLLRTAGVDLPIVAEHRWLFFSAPLSQRLLDPLVVATDRRFAAKQLADGRVLASDLAATGDADESRPEWRRHVRETILELLPILQFVELPLLVGGTYDVTPDHQAIVGRVPGHENLFVAAGFSGHGFMMAPEIGRGVAAMVVGEDTDETFTPLRPDRFADGTLEHEAAIV